ncbi:serine hydrolase [Longimicrobium sp.]|uniref:serine hydrolase n=1 Tax=Longimicrobium sp. TaxID=2029185 RepID=UPI003B3A02D1
MHVTTRHRVPIRRIVLVLAAALALAACREEASPWAHERVARMTLREKVAQMVAPALYVGADARPAQDTVLARRLATEAVGGVRLLPGSAEVAERRVALLQRFARRPLLVIADLDRGVGGTMAGAEELPPPASLGALDDETVGRIAARAAEGAGRIGINFGLLSAPSFPYAAGLPGPSGAQAERAFADYAAGLADAGLVVGVRALSPGPEPADSSLRVLAWDRAAAEALQLDLLRTLLERGVGGVKPASVAIPSLTRDSVPLPDNPVFVTGVLRRDLGFDGVVIEDLAPPAPLVLRYGPGEAAVRAVAAGADLLVGVEDPRIAIDAIVQAVESGRIAQTMIDASVGRVFAAKEKLGLGMQPAAQTDAKGNASQPAGNAPPSAQGADTLAAAAHRAALSVLGRTPREALRGCRTTVLVTDRSVLARPLSAALTAAIPGLTHLRTGRLPRRGPLVSPRVPFAAADADCVVAAAFPGARPRVVDRIVPALPQPDSAARDTLPASRLAALRRDTTARRIVWIDFFPAVDAPAPTATSLVLARGTGPLAQRAAAAALADSAGRRSPAGMVWPPARMLRIVTPDSVGMRVDSLARIDSVMRIALADTVFTAAAVAIGRRGRLVKLQGYGRTSGQAVDPRITLFDIASLSKVVGTTAAVMALVDDDRLELGAPVRRYVPGYRGEGRGDITVRQLLTHTAGLPAGDWLYGSASSPEQALRQVMRTDLVTQPGERMVYSDFGMILMAEAVRRVAEEPMDRFLARRVFGPLGMQNTFYLPPAELQRRAVPTAEPGRERPYEIDGVVHDGNAYRLGGVAGHAGLFSTAWDLAVYSQTLLNGGAYGTRRVWDGGTVASFTRRQPNAATRALGWDTPAARSSAGSYLSERSFGHTGFTGTSIWLDPTKELFVIVLTNRTYPGGGQGDILRIRGRVADLAAKAITDQPVTPRPGSPAAIEAAERAAAAARARERARRRRPPARRPRRRAEIETVAPAMAWTAPARLVPGTPVKLPGMPGWMIVV